MKNILLDIAAIMTAIVIITCFIKVDNTDEMALAEVFQEDIYYDITSDVEATVYIGNEYINEDDKKSIILDIADRLGIKDGYDYTSKKTETGYSAALTKDAVKADTCIRITTVEKQLSGSQIALSQYLYIRIDFQGSPESTAYYKEKLDTILEDMKLSGRVSVNYRGKCSGNLSIEEKNNITFDIIQQLKGKIVDSKRTNDIFTVYGYTEYIGESMKINGKKANLNVAFSYNEEDNATEIYVSAPIISTDY